MRKHLFRGKRTDNKEWICAGNIIRFNEDGLVYIPEQNSKCGCVHDEDENILSIEYGTFYRVDPDTVGHFTGLTDKNDVPIFESDIVFHHGEDEYGKIEWDEQGARYIIELPGLIVDFDNTYAHELEVVGNIFDNPELLEDPADD